MLEKLEDLLRAGDVALVKRWVEVAARLILLGSHTIRVVGRAEFDPVRALGR